MTRAASANTLVVITSSLEVQSRRSGGYDSVYFALGLCLCSIILVSFVGLMQYIIDLMLAIELKHSRK